MNSPNGAGPPDSLSANDLQELTTGGEPLHLMHSFGRKCAECGRMTWPGMAGAAPRWTEDPEEWSAAPDNCRSTRPSPPAGPDSLSVPQYAKSNPSNGLVERLKDGAKQATMTDLVGWFRPLFLEAAAEIERLQRAQQEGVKSSPPPAKRVAEIFDDWLNVFGPVEIKHTSAQEYAVDAVMDLREAVLAALSPPIAPASQRGESELSAEDDAYEIGKRDGYEEAVQRIDLLTGGDGEYRFCTDGDPDRHTPDAAAMTQRIVERQRGENRSANASLRPTLHGAANDASKDAKEALRAALRASPATPIGGLSLGVEGDRGASRANSGGTAQAPKSERPRPTDCADRLRCDWHQMLTEPPSDIWVCSGLNCGHGIVPLAPK